MRYVDNHRKLLYYTFVFISVYTFSTINKTYAMAMKYNNSLNKEKYIENRENEEKKLLDPEKKHTQKTFCLIFLISRFTISASS